MQGKSKMPRERRAGRPNKMQVGVAVEASLSRRYFSGDPYEERPGRPRIGERAFSLEKELV